MAPQPTAPLPAELDRIYADHFPYVLSFIRRMDPREGDAEDLAQDVFVQAGKKLDEYDPARGAMRAWLGGIAWRLVKSSRRRRRREQLDIDLGDRPAPGTPERDAALKQITHFLLDKIPEERRLILVLHDAEHCTRSEIADILQIPEGTVSSRLQKARSELRSEVARLCARDRIEAQDLCAVGVPLLAADLSDDPRAWTRHLDLDARPSPDVIERGWRRVLSQGDLARAGAPARSVGDAGRAFGDAGRTGWGAASAAGSKVVVLGVGQLVAGALAFTAVGALVGAGIHGGLEAPPSLTASVAVGQQLLPPNPSVASTSAAPAAALATSPLEERAATLIADSRPPLPPPRIPRVMSSMTPAVSVAAPAPSPNPMAEETADSLMNRIRSAVSSHPAQALALSERHAALFPNKNAQERSAYVIVALARTGQNAAAAARAEAFRNAYPKSPFLGVIDAAVGSKAGGADQP